jgi:hypothetical protein
MKMTVQLCRVPDEPEKEAVAEPAPSRSIGMGATSHRTQVQATRHYSVGSNRIGIPNSAFAIGSARVFTLRRR